MIKNVNAGHEKKDDPIPPEMCASDPEYRTWMNMNPWGKPEYTSTGGCCGYSIETAERTMPLNGGNYLTKKPAQDKEGE